jgi:hypothetical protein
VDKWDPVRLFISNNFNNVESVPVFFSENGRLGKAEILGYFRVLVGIVLHLATLALLGKFKLVESMGNTF